MRRWSALALLVVGVFLVVLAPLLRWAVYPALAKAPLDENTASASSGTGQYLDGTSPTGQVRTGQIDVERIIVANPALQAKVDSDTTAVWQVTTVVDSPQTLAAPRPDGAYSWTTETWAFDRTTGAPTTDSQVQAEAFLKFPFDTQKRTYSYWDTKAGKAFPAQYKGTEKFKGRTVYKFVSVVPDTQVPSPVDPTTTVTYSNPQSVALVDPTTGTIVGGSSHQIVTSDGETVFDAVLSPTPAATKDLLDLAAKGDVLAALHGPVALACLILGLIALAGAAVLGLGLGRPHRGGLRGSEPAPREGGRDVVDVRTAAERGEADPIDLRTTTPGAVTREGRSADHR